MADHTSELDLTKDPAETAAPAAAQIESSAVSVSQPYDPNKEREGTRGDLARGLLWLLAVVIGGVLVFVGVGRLDGTVITQSIFPSLIALAGTALGFYFGSQSGKNGDSSGPATSQPLVFKPASAPSNDGGVKNPAPVANQTIAQNTGAQDQKADDTNGG